MENISHLSSFVDFITSFFDSLFLFFTDTLIDILSDFTSWLVVKLTVLSIQSKLFFLEVSWNAASSILSQFNIGDTISTYVSMLSPTVSYIANSIGFFDGLNLILQASITNYVMRLMGV